MHGLGRDKEAVAHYEEALRARPDFDRAHFNLATVLDDQGRIEEAVAHYEQALRLKPDSANVHNRLGRLYERQRDFQMAAAQYELSLRIKPDDAQVHSRLASVFYQNGQSQAAVKRYRMALRFNPDDSMAANNLAWLLATHPDQRIRNGQEAVSLGERLNSRTKGSRPDVLDTLAAAYAEVGRFKAAAESAQKGIVLAEKAERAGLAKQLEARLRLYEAQQPYREPAPK